jgi:hypothetical protein
MQKNLLIGSKVDRWYRHTDTLKHRQESDLITLLALSLGRKVCYKLRV